MDAHDNYTWHAQDYMRPMHCEGWSARGGLAWTADCRFPCRTSTPWSCVTASWVLIALSWLSPAFAVVCQLRAPCRAGCAGESEADLLCASDAFVSKGLARGFLSRPFSFPAAACSTLCKLLRTRIIVPWKRRHQGEYFSIFEHCCLPTVSFYGQHISVSSV